LQLNESLRPAANRAGLGFGPAPCLLKHSEAVDIEPSPVRFDSAIGRAVIARLLEVSLQMFSSLET
jgi:hypothetical protein